MYLSVAPSPTAGLLGGDLWQDLRHDGRVLGWLALLQVAFILAAWLAGRALVPRREMNHFGQFEKREGGTFGKALLLYLAYLLVVVAVVAGLNLTGTPFQLAMLEFLASPGHLAWNWVGLFAVLALVLLVIKVGLPMLIYRLRLGRAIGLLALIGLLLIGAGWGLDVALGRPVEARTIVIRDWASRRTGHGGLLKSLATQAQEEIEFSATETIGYDTSRPMRERKDAVSGLFKQLEQIRTTLPDGDPIAVGEYNRKKTRYEALLKQLKTELSAQPSGA